MSATIRIQTTDGEEHRVTLTLTIPEIITLSAMIAEGYERGAVHCLPPTATATDVMLFNELAKVIREMGHHMIEYAQEDA